jgi:tetratricopeptide (TPR) repeat protein
MVKMTAVHVDDPALDNALLHIGEEYQYAAHYQRNAGQEVAARENCQRAIGIFEDIIRDFPDTRPALIASLFAGDAYLFLSQPGEALGHYQRAAAGSDFRFNWQGQFMVGKCYEDMKESGQISASEANSQAKIAYELLLAKYPSCPAAQAAANYLQNLK